MKSKFMKKQIPLDFTNKVNSNTSPHIMCFSLPAGFLPPLSVASSSATARMWYGSNLGEVDSFHILRSGLKQFISWNFYPQQPPM